MKSSIYDVAKRAGVSISTVSRVLNQSAGVKESKALAVKEAMEYFNYEPSQFGRGLVKQKSNLIGVYSAYRDSSIFEATFSLECLRGIDAIASKNGYSLLLINEEQAYNSKKKKKPKFLEYVNQHRIDGLIVLGTSEVESIRKDLELAMKDGFPIAYVGRRFSEKGINVYAQFEHCFNQMIKKLYEAGHREILAFVPKLHIPKLEEVEQNVCKELEGLRLCLTSYQAEQGEALIARAGEVLTEQVIEGRCTAVCTADIFSTTIIMRECQNKQIQIPEDLSLIALEHKRGEGELLFPPVNAFLIPSQKMGRLVAEKLIHMMQDQPEEESQIVLATTYLERASVKEMSH